MKKLCSLLLCLTLVLSMAACGATETTPATTTNPPTEAATATEAATTPVPSVEQDVQASDSQATASALVHLTGEGQFGFGAGYIMGYNDNGIYTFKNIKYGNAERFKHSTPQQGVRHGRLAQLCHFQWPRGPSGRYHDRKRKGRQRSFPYPFRL